MNAPISVRTKLLSPRERRTTIQKRLYLAPCVIICCRGRIVCSTTLRVGTRSMLYVRSIRSARMSVLHIIFLLYALWYPVNIG